MAVTIDDIAAELGRTAPTSDDPTHAQWTRWIARAEGTIERQAQRCGIPYSSLDASAVDEVVTYIVARLARVPADGALSVSEQVGVDDGTAQETRRYGTAYGDVHVLDQWWDILGLCHDSGRRRAFTIRLGGRAGFR